MNGLYDWLLEHATGVAREEPVERVCLGLSWTLAEVGDSLGFAFGPRQVPRTLSWAGTLGGQACERLYPWLRSWNTAESAVGLAVLNAVINRASPCLRQAQPLRGEAPGNLSVFEHFRPRLDGQKVAVIGHYPGLAQLWQDLPYRCFEREPQDGDLPDTAVEQLLPEADWVFITASSLANKTLPRLLELSSHAQVVLMGPSLPWIYDWRRFGVNYLAGVRVQDARAACQVVAEGGGTRLFAGPVEYALLGLDS
ncbi:Rossmann-like domain-containing protein [Azotobacter chroococcum]|jgi:uncharacterized protein (DUF4213/DUF364 family)|uniref:Heavy-metal chelation domain-containing protein n=1 Tax=Azotobacter chroococcum TaxID=353 RepID=A0A4V2Q774_9GAMM|nr:DUF364 domain-containing protein [Azotobacter chroococcum]TCL28673.1 hypothetical protein EV691_12029 [Azotobacter chroococcum]